MRRLAIPAVNLLALAVAACDPAPVLPTPAPSPTATSTPNTNGPCHDGTDLKPGEQCP